MTSLVPSNMSAKEISVLCLLLCSLFHRASATFSFGGFPTFGKSLTAQLPNGVNIKGEFYGDLARFLGIPYATASRWAPPKPVEWQVDKKPYEATVVSYRCHWQFEFHNPALDHPHDVFLESEECLELSILTHPLHEKNEKLPVMVWFHGTLFPTGGVPWRVERGYKLVKEHKVILVTVNYRTGIWGFGSNPKMMKNNGGLNFGLQDQRESLRWIRNNIQYFGGDPDRITVFGEDLGAASIAYHMTWNENEGLFQQAILQSGTPNTFPLLDQKEAYQHFTEVAQLVHCTQHNYRDQLDCMRSRKVAEIEAAVKLYGQSIEPGTENENFLFTLWSPVLDGVIVTADPNYKLQQGVIDPSIRSVIVGANKYETQWLVTKDVRVNDHVAFTALVKPGSAKIEDSALGKFMDSQKTCSLEDALTVLNHLYFFCPALATARELTALNIPVYKYYFSESVPDPDADYKPRKFHGAELCFLFEIGKICPILKNQQLLRDAMLKYWADFATLGHPNGAGRWLEWPKFGNEEWTIDLQSTPYVSRDREVAAKCRFVNFVNKARI